MNNLFNLDFQGQRIKKIKQKRECLRVKELIFKVIGSELQEGLIVLVQQVVCQDPTCAPLDTAVHLTWLNGLSKGLTIPVAVSDVTKEILQVSGCACVVPTLVGYSIILST